MGIKTFNE